MTDGPTPGGIVPDAEANPGDLSAADDQLLGRLLYAGVLPRYAFPTDVTSFYVFDVGESTPYQTAFMYSPQQGMTTALSQYAPGKEIFIDGKRFTSGALYSPFKHERDKAWEKRRWYYECRNCGYAKTESISQGVRGEVLTCPACGLDSGLGPARYWLRPPGFAHPSDVVFGTTPDDAPVKSYPTRAKLLAPSPAEDSPDWQVVNDLVRVQYLRGRLLVTNNGPQGDGYSYCVACGRIEPATLRTGVLNGAHRKPFPDRTPDCMQSRVARNLCLGTDYITDILLIQLRVEEPVQLPPGLLATETVLRTVSDAVAKAACLYLELEVGEIGAEFRPALSEDGIEGRVAEVYLYDTLPGGAGFSRQIGENAQEVLELASHILQGCRCDSSCYECLRSFKNRFDHRLLDRIYGNALLDHLLRGTLPQLPTRRASEALDLLASDVLRQGGLKVSAERNCRVDDPSVGSVAIPLVVRSAGGQRCGVVVTHPLAPTFPGSAELLEWLEMGTTMSLRCVTDLMVAKALPQVTQEILSAVGIREMGGLV